MQITRGGESAGEGEREGGDASSRAGSSPRIARLLFTSIRLFSGLIKGRAGFSETFMDGWVKK